MVLLTVPSSAGFTRAANNTITGGSVVTQKGQDAGYEVVSSFKPGSTLYAQAMVNVPSVTCTTGSQFLIISVGVGHVSPGDAFSELNIVCEASIGGLAANYFMEYYDGSYGGTINAPVKPGDVINTMASESLTTGATTVSIQDPKESWAATYNGNVGTSSAVEQAFWYLMGNVPSSSNPLLSFIPVKFSGLSATVRGHTGSLGSFKSLKGFTIYEFILVDSSNNHVLAKPTSITSTSKSFKVNWITGY